MKVYNETEAMGTVVDYITSIATALDNNTALFVVGDHGYLILVANWNSRKTKESKYVPLLVYKPNSSFSTKKAQPPTLVSDTLSILSIYLSIYPLLIILDVAPTISAYLGLPGT